MPVDMTKTMIGSAGTMRWRAPELLLGEEPNTYASDVYAFAMVCYEVSHTRNFTASLVTIDNRCFLANIHSKISPTLSSTLP
jgi:serine/threonine protein kinase